jgi:hypothetical protein
MYSTGRDRTQQLAVTHTFALSNPNSTQIQGNVILSPEKTHNSKFQQGFDTAAQGSFADEKLSGKTNAHPHVPG